MFLALFLSQISFFSYSAPIEDKFFIPIEQGNYTVWTGKKNRKWEHPANWSNGLPSIKKNCIIYKRANNPIINKSKVTCKDALIKEGAVVTTRSGGILEVFGSFINFGNVDHISGRIIMCGLGLSSQKQFLYSPTPIRLSLSQMRNESVQVIGETHLIDLFALNKAKVRFRINKGALLCLESSISLKPNFHFSMQSSSQLLLGKAANIFVKGGSFSTEGIIDAYPHNTFKKSYIGPKKDGDQFTLEATSGDVSLQGAILDSLDANGLQILGQSDLLSLDGTQLIHLPSTSEGLVSAITLDTTTEITETFAENFGWNWGSANSTLSPTTPNATDAYYLVNSNSCGNQSIVFNQWFGDFWSQKPNIEAKIKDIKDSPKNRCHISISSSASPVLITSASLQQKQNNIEVQWQTGFEIDHIGFNVYRSSLNHSLARREKLNTYLISKNFSGPSGRNIYKFTDTTLTTDATYYYFLEDLSITGDSNFNGPLEIRYTSQLNRPIAPLDESRPANPIEGEVPTEYASSDTSEIVNIPEIMFMEDINSKKISIEINKSGFYELVVGNELPSPVYNTLISWKVSELVLHNGQDSVPMLIEGSEDFIQDGTRIVFYADSQPNFYDHTQKVYFEKDISTTFQANYIIPQQIDPNPSSQNLSNYHYSTVTLENDNYFLMDRYFSGLQKHYFWKRLYVSTADTSQAELLDIPFTLDSPIQDDKLDFTLELFVRPRGSELHWLPEHLIKVFINGTELQFSQEPILNNKLASYSFSGSSTLLSDEMKISIKILSENLSDSEYSIVDLDSIKLSFPKKNTNKNMPLTISDSPQNNGYSIDLLPNSYIFKINSPYDINYISSSTDVLPKLNSRNPYASYKIVHPVQMHKSSNVHLNYSPFLNSHSIEYLSNYIVIAPSALIPFTRKLIRHRRNQGLKPSLYSYQSIYNSYSSGSRDPKAITKFLANFRDIKYLLFIGDTSLDPNGLISTNKKRLPSMPLVQGRYSHFPSDNWYAKDAGLSNIAIGRLPTESAEVLSGYIEKLIAYEKLLFKNPQQNRTAMFFSDKSLKNENFEQRNQSYGRMISSHFMSSYFSRENLTDSNIKEKLYKAFLNQTDLLVLNGHGAEDMWASRSVFSNSDVANLSANDLIPLVLSFNCLNAVTSFTNETQSGLGENMVFSNNSGALGFWGSTTLTSPIQQDLLASDLFSEIDGAFRNSTFRAGDLTASVLSKYFYRDDLSDIFLSWNFIGDPALILEKQALTKSSIKSDADIQSVSENGQDFLASSNSRQIASGCSANAASKYTKAPQKHLIILSLIFEFLFSFFFLKLVRRILVRAQ